MTAEAASPRSPSMPARETARLAALLAWVAGGVDAIGYLTLAHVFTAHMSGNSVGFGAALGQARWDTVLIRGVPIAVFVVGIVVGTVVGEASDARGARHPAVPVFGVEVALLAVFWLLGGRLLRDHEIVVGAAWQFYGLVALLTLAMGLQSATLRRVGSHEVHTTYVSGILTSLAVTVGQALFQLHAGPLHTGAPDSPARRIRLYGGIWSGYLIGAILGGALLAPVGLAALALPIAGLGIAIVHDLRHPYEIAAMKGL